VPGCWAGETFPRVAGRAALPARTLIVRFRLWGIAVQENCHSSVGLAGLHRRGRRIFSHKAILRHNGNESPLPLDGSEARAFPQ
jgi:hypothetical protein